MNVSHLHTTFLLPTKLDLAKFTLTDRVAENVLAKLGVLLSLAEIVPTPATASRFFAMLFAGRIDQRSRVV